MSQKVMAEELAVLAQLNTDYVNAFLNSDPQRYSELVTEDFICIAPNGRVLDRAAFLDEAKAPANMEYFHVEEVQIRLYGDFAQMSARTPYKTKDGREGVNRYIDCWMKQDDGQWRAISAQITRVL